MKAAANAHHAKKGWFDAFFMLKTQAAQIPGCILNAAQCPVPELVALTRQMQALRERLRSGAA